MPTSFEENLGREFTAGTRDADQQIAMMVEQARAIGMTVGVDLLAFFGLLPGALARAQEHELARLVRANGEAHPRVVEARESLARSRLFADTAAAGQARAQRAFAAQFATDWLFHGFVSDRDGRPLPRYKVELSAPRMKETLSSATAADGYFRIALPRAEADALDKLGRDEKDGMANAGRARIRAPDGRPVYDDPLPIAVGHGRLAVRDYALDLPEDDRKPG